MSIDTTIPLIVSEISLSGAVSLGDASASTYARYARRINEYLKKERFEWRVRAEYAKRLISPVATQNKED